MNTQNSIFEISRNEIFKISQKKSYRRRSNQRLSHVEVNCQITRLNPVELLMAFMHNPERIVNTHLGTLEPTVGTMYVSIIYYSYPF